MLRDPRKDGVLFPIPDVSGVEVRQDVALSRADPDGATTELRFDVYLPPRTASSHYPPVVLFVHGDAPAAILQDAKDWAAFRSWGQLMATSGIAAVTFNRRSTENFTRIADAENEVKAMLEHLHSQADAYGFDADRVGVWTGSAGSPTVMPLLLRERPEYVRGVVVYYGVLDLEPVAGASPSPPLPEAFRPYSAAAVLRDLPSVEGVPPLLIVRAGRDRPLVNQNLDRFLAVALERNIAIEVLNHPEGEHGFDVLNDVPRTQEAIGQTLDFLHRHLG